MIIKAVALSDGLISRYGVLMRIKRSLEEKKYKMYLCPKVSVESYMTSYCGIAISSPYEGERKVL